MSYISNPNKHPLKRFLRIATSTWLAAVVSSTAFLPAAPVAAQAEIASAATQAAPEAPSAGSSTDTLVGLTLSNTLVTFNGATPGTILSTVALTGMASGENIVAIDYRPATQKLIALGDSGRLYAADTQSGNLSLLSAAPFTLTGSTFGLDFNPTVDRIRLVSDARQNLRLHPDTGAVVFTDGNLAYATGDINQVISPTVTSAAYTNSFSGTRSTQLFVIDTVAGVLAKQGSGTVSPNTGSLFTVGSLGVLTATQQAGFDISTGGIAYATFIITATPTSALYTINLDTGAATLVGTIGLLDTVRDIAILPQIVKGSPNDLLYGLTVSNTLVTFNAATPNTIQMTMTLTGMQTGEDLLSLDFRPATQQLVAIGNSNRLYAISLPTGTLTAINDTPFSPTLSGSASAIDFNPTVDRLRLVGNTGQNLRFNLATPLTPTVDGTLAYTTTDTNAATTPKVLAAGYTNNFAGARTTQLFVIDAATRSLVKQGSGSASPNSGQLFTVGPLGLGNEPQYAGLDISTGGTTYASFTAISGTQSVLVVVNLATGAAKLIGAIGGNAVIKDIAVGLNLASAGSATDGTNGQYKADDLLAGLTMSNTLALFKASQPMSITRIITLTGMDAGESIIGLDYRPATRQPYALGSNNKLYQVDLETGALTLLGGGAFSPTLSSPNTAIDFNPAVDRLRVVGANKQNLRFNLASAITPTVDSMLAYTSTDALSGTMPSVVAAAYTNNRTGITATQLYVLDSVQGILAKQGSGAVSPNSGTLFPAGSLAISSVDGVLGFDIAPGTSPYLTLRTPGTAQSNLYVVDLATGKAHLVGGIGSPVVLRDVAVMMNYVIYLPIVINP